MVPGRGVYSGGVERGGRKNENTERKKVVLPPLAPIYPRNNGPAMEGCAGRLIVGQ